MFSIYVSDLSERFRLILRKTPTSKTARCYKPASLPADA